jgi:hypothetical protein
MDSENNYNNSENTGYQQEAGSHQNETNPERLSVNNEPQSRDADNDTGNKDRTPSKGVAGVMGSNFGSDKTTTSTFEKSQGEKFGANFDDNGARLKEKFGEFENQSAGDVKASGSGATRDGKQSNKDTHSSHTKGNETGTHKDGFGQKFKHRAEGR